VDEEGLDAETVPGQNQGSLADVVEPEGEHPVDAIERLLHPEVDQGLEEDLGIAGGPEADPPFDQFRLQALVVVELAVVDQTVPARGVPHGLVAALVQVHEGEACVGEGEAHLSVESAPVGPAVAHAPERFS
jgi:hypothetical protein